MKKIIFSFSFSLSFILLAFSQPLMVVDTIPWAIYPEVNASKPDLPSPFQTPDGQEYVLAETKAQKFALIPVTLSNDWSICKQLVVDTFDFPDLAKRGLHDPSTLEKTVAITNRPLDQITELGRPGGLSQGGFMAEDEDILSVIKGDNRLVQKLGLTHPQMAKPLFHILNMMDTDLALDRWNMAKHQWENIPHFYYRGQKVQLQVEDTKGGQRSIFDDGIMGAFYIKVWRELSVEEVAYLQKHYSHLGEARLNEMVNLLSLMNLGEMQAQYIMRYGFYEGHTFWRADPIAISFIFGLKSLEEMDKALSHKLYDALTQHYVN